MERLLDLVLRGLRYRELRRVIGRTVKVDGCESIVSDLSLALGGDLPWSISVHGPPLERYIPGQVAESGRMDLTFVAVESIPDHPEDAAGLTLLQDLGFLPSQFHLEHFPGEPDPTGLSCLVEAMGEGLNFVRIFLTTRAKVAGREASLPPVRCLPPPTPPRGRLFPREFVVEDACLTNAYPVWLHKHFYL